MRAEHDRIERRRHNVTGAIEHVLPAEAKDLAAHKAFHTEILGTAPQVLAISSYIVMESTKDERAQLRRNIGSEFGEVGEGDNSSLRLGIVSPEPPMDRRISVICDGMTFVVDAIPQPKIIVRQFPRVLRKQDE